MGLLSILVFALAIFAVSAYRTHTGAEYYGTYEPANVHEAAFNRIAGIEHNEHDSSHVAQGYDVSHAGGYASHNVEHGDYGGIFDVAHTGEAVQHEGAHGFDGVDAGQHGGMDGAHGLDGKHHEQHHNEHEKGATSFVHFHMVSKGHAHGGHGHGHGHE